jgi:hypothetical protein
VPRRLSPERRAGGGITCASAALSDAAEDNLAGRAPPIEVEHALNRLLDRIAAH